MLSPNESPGSLGTDRPITSRPPEALIERYRELGYALGEEIGRGRTGVVHQAIHETTGMPVAIKRLHAVDPEGLHDLKREFRTLFGGDHRGIAKVYELVADSSDPFFVMELIEGPDLVRWVRQDLEPHQTDDALIARLIDALTQLSATLAWLHRSGRVHRDVKPSNVRVQEGRVVLIDFDLSALVGGAHRETLDSAGTLAYMPNEALWGGETSTSADVYALGVLAYECLTGERAFQSTNPVELHREKNRGLPPLPATITAQLDLLLRRMTSTEPSERPTAAALTSMLVGELDAEPDPTSLPTESEADDAVGRLLEAFQRRDPARPSLFCVSGPPGAGKTHVANRFFDRVKREHDCLILEGRCLPTATGPFQGVDGVVDTLAETLARWDSSEVARTVPAEVTDVLELFPVMARVPAFADAASESASHGNAIDRRLRGFNGLRTLLGTLAEAQPLIVLIDDLQWIDEASARFWADLLAGQSPIVVLAVARSEEALSALQLGEGAVSLSLHLESFGGDAEAQVSLPTLSADAQRLLQAASLAFVPTDLQTLGRAVSSENPMISTLELARAGGLIHHTKLDPKMAVTPCDEGVRRATEGSLSPEGRRALHRALAEALETSEDDAYAVAAFWHWHAADQPHVARRFATKTGARLMERMAFEQAAKVYEAALEVGDKQGDALALMRQLAEALEAAGHGKSAGEAYARAANHAEAVGEASNAIRDLRRRSAESFLRAGYIAEGNSMLDETLPEFQKMPQSNAGLLLFLFKERAHRMLPSSRKKDTNDVAEDSSARLDALWSGTVGTVWADLQRSMVYQALHASFASRSDDPVHQSRAMSAEGCYLAAISPSLFGPSAERLGAKSLQIAEEHGDPNLIAMARCTWACTSFLRGDWAAAIRRSESIVDWIEDRCSAAEWELSTAYLYSAWSLGFHGDLPAIEAFRTKVLQRARAHDDRLALTSVSVGLPNLTWLARGRPDLARASTSEAMRAWRSPSYSPFHFLALFGETLTDLYCGDAVEARGRFEVETQALRRTFLRQHPIIRPLLHYLNVQTALAAVQQSPSSVAAKKLRRSARRSRWRLRFERAPWSRAFSLAAGAQWDATYGRPEAADRGLLLAEEAFRGANMALYAEAARFHRARLSGAATPSFTASIADPDAMAYCLMPVAAP